MSYVYIFILPRVAITLTVWDIVGIFNLQVFKIFIYS